MNSFGESRFFIQNLDAVTETSKIPLKGAEQTQKEVLKAG